MPRITFAYGHQEADGQPTKLTFTTSEDRDDEVVFLGVSRDDDEEDDERVFMAPRAMMRAFLDEVVALCEEDGGDG